MLYSIFEGKPKYTLLDDLIGDKVSDVTIGSTVNIIVDMKQVYRKMFRNSIELEDNSPEYLKLETERITSDIVGLVSHYRNYFYKKGKYTSFFFIYSENECEYMKAMDPNYKKDYYEKYFNSNENRDKIELLKRCNHAFKILITGYIPNAYYVDSSDFDELVYMKYIIDSAANSDLNIILSNDENVYQLVNHKNTYCLTLSGVDTKAICRDNLYTALDIKEQLSPGLFSILLALSGNSRYSISGVNGFGFKRGAKLLRKLIDEGRIQNAEYVIFPLREEDLPEGKFEIAKHNFSVFVCDRTYSENKLAISRKIVKNKKIVSYEEFNELNCQVFRNYPIDTTKILRGELI